MLKKNVKWISIVGALLLFFGIITNPIILTKLKSFPNEWTIVKLNLISFYFIISGIVILISALINSFINKSENKKLLWLIIFAVGLFLIGAAVIFNPSFVQQNFSPSKFINDDGMSRLLNYQIIIIIFGFIVSLVSLWVYFSKGAKFFNFKNIAAFAIGLLSFIYIINQVYFIPNFPNNIIFNFSAYDKVKELLLGKQILLTDFSPNPTLVVKRKEITKAKFPVIDVHFHLASDFRTELDKDLMTPEALVKSMDSVNVRAMINMDGIDINAEIQSYHGKYPDRFINYAYPILGSGKPVTEEDFANLPVQIENLAKRGIKGIGEFSKYLGISIKDINGKIIPIDDSRLDPMWKKIDELKLPIIWHLTDPTAFFQPITCQNERFTELGRYPFWSYYKPGIPDKITIMKQQENVIKKYPNIIFIAAHMGMNADNLDRLAYMLDTYPNYYTETAAVLSELGRQPYTTRKFFIKYQDKILFGSDGGALHGVHGWTVEKFYQSNFEFFETENEYIDYPMKGAINQGNWSIYGINLPDEVLEKLYYKNAERILFGNK